jgi:hypothetical protein
MVFRYSAAATAGFVIAGPIVGFVASIARVLLAFATFAFIGGVGSFILWLNSNGGADTRWAVTYLLTAAIVFVAAVLPLMLGGWFVLRFVSLEEEKDNG